MMKVETNLCDLFTDILSGKKPPPEDEKIWITEPLFAFLYAKYIKKGRLSEEVEGCFCNNLAALSNYIDWVVFDLQEELPHHLHNLMLAQYISNNDNEIVNNYFSKLK